MKKLEWLNGFSALTLVAFVVLLAGCATPLRIEKIAEFKPQSRTVALLTTTRFDSKLRIALAKKGFRVLKFASNRTVIQEGEGKEIAEVYNKAEAKYVLSFHYATIDSCILNDAIKINATWELSDVAKNEVVLLIERGGWTAPCGYHGTGKNVFDELTEALASEWDKAK